ncbi:carboxypeptidase-like regulatory domain-containing protein [Flavobacterium sp. 17A]|uniref:Carboxypeptidase-like regulatory domain-containing protein n=1 Tax=Flavobacterium potami TaxID=2872310 RepID=A0A9X1HDE8_9FLAO|nr:carboxypeptidase-like regulatory domain-containing protein [Flavobacterium potami]MBZ4036312.1 carboxypeptidase-like regulatory domain-containing protein [Flavobacterium potami]
MKIKLLTIISFFTYQISISQNEKLLQGKVLSQNIPLNKVEVINKTAKTSTTTNELGEFSILAKAQDSLLFFSKDYLFKRLKISQENMNQNNIIVNMILKPEELNEVVVTNVEFDKVKFDADAVADVLISKNAKDLFWNTGVNDNTIREGLRVAFPLKGKPKKKIEPEDDRVKKLILAYCPPDFFIKNLKLKPEEKELFIKFCDADPKSKTLLVNPNVLTVMDFLYLKNEEFKTLK